MSDLRERTYIDGELESMKFDDKRESYYRGLEEMIGMGYPMEDFVHHYPCFVGHLTLSRFLTLHDCYQKTLGISGHIADVGVYKGASLLYFSKLVQIYEPVTLTQVHGFDWFQGNAPTDDDPRVLVGSSTESYERVSRLVELQSLQSIVRLHKVDLSKELGAFFEKHPHLQFKLIFMDTGTYEVVNACLPLFWEHLSKGGMMVFDQYNTEIAPGETRAVRQFFEDKGCIMQTFPSGWMPTAYVVK